MRILSLLLIALLLSGCAGQEVLETTQEWQNTVPVMTVPSPEVPSDPLDALLASMTLEEKAGQLFLARCNAESALADIENYHLGGLVLFAVDFEKEDPVTLTAKLRQYQQAAAIPLLLAVDEEGGIVTRISRYSAFRSRPFPSTRETYDSGGMDWVLAVEDEKCALLKNLGLNVNLGPVCDITTDPGAFLYARSLGQDAQTTARFVSRTVELMDRYQIGSVLKHFPGYGNNADTHTGIVRDSRSLGSLEQTDLVPFAAGIEAGCGAILVSHTIVEALDPELPASLSPAVHRYLRQDMGFSGVIVTDDLVMQAITDRYGAGEAAVMALQTGNDLLCATDYPVQYEAILDALASGRISRETLDAAVRRVLAWKQELGLL